MSLKRRHVFSMGIVLAGLFLLMSTILAQSNETILTLAVQEWQQDVYSDELFADFEAANPGVKVVVETLGQDDNFYGSPLFDMEGFQERVSNYVANADVLPVATYQMSPAATRGGYFLDMSPLLAGDATLDTSDFFEPMLQSFQWAGGTWALPISGQVTFLIYDRNAFDEAGLSYPDENWTISDFIEAGRSLTVRDENGDIENPALVGFDDRLLFRALLGRGLYDDSVIPEMPALVDADLAALLDAWKAYQQEMFGDEGPDYSQIDFNTMPLAINGAWMLNNSAFGNQNSDTDYAASLLPGGIAGLQVEGFAISAGTSQPLLAYELIKYLTGNAEVVNRFFGDSPARRSMVGVESEEDNFFFGPERDEETQALIDRALENALPASELRYFDAATGLAQSRVDPENPVPDDMMQALEEQQVELLDAFAALENSTAEVNVVVATPVPTPVLTAEEVALRFHVYEIISPIPNRDEWEALLADFIANDPDVGFVELSTGFGLQADSEQELDCYYRSSNIVPSTDLSTLLPLDPFLAADVNFDESELVPGVMGQVRRDGQTWALPLSVQPIVLWYNSAVFDEAGAFPPFTGWTTADFEDALQQLSAAGEDTPFEPRQSGNTYILMLAAAYGGVAVDYSTSPPTYKLTDPTVIEALREALNLVKEGYIDYKELAGFGGSGGGGFGDTTPLYDSFLSSLDWRFSNRGDNSADVEDPYQLVSFPRGLEFIPAAFDLGTGYISADTLNPEACYRLLSYVSQSTALFNAMPVRPSLIDSVADADDVAAVYREMADVLAQPDVINIPTPFTGTGGFGSFLMQMWMNRAFDQYVLEDANLETALEDAQRFIDDYAQCIASIEEIPQSELQAMEVEEIRAYSNQYNECAIQVDPSMEEMLRPIMGTDDE